MDSEEEIFKNFFKTIEQSFAGINQRTLWPLNGAQIDSYFDIDEALDMYDRLNKLKEKLTIKEIAKLMPPPDLIKHFIENNAIIGLKVANKLGIRNISREERTKYLLFLFEIIKEKVKNDIFCLDGKNHLHDNKEVSKILNETVWDIPKDDEEKRKIAFLSVMSNNLCYTLFYDLFMVGGFYIHGPYNVEEKFGNNTIMIIREYHDIKPTDLWPELEMPYKKLKLCSIYKDLDLKLNFINHPITKEHIGPKLIAYKIFLDDNEIKINQVDELIDLFHKVSSSQTKKINSMPDLEKVKKGSEIAYYFFKNLRENMGDDWRPPKEIERTIEKIGEEFLIKFKYNKTPDLNHWKNLFDPRNDYF